MFCLFLGYLGNTYKENTYSFGSYRKKVLFFRDKKILV